MAYDLKMAIATGMKTSGGRAKMSGEAKQILIDFLHTVAIEWAKMEENECSDSKAEPTSISFETGKALMKSNNAVIDSNKALVGLIEEQSRSCERLLATVNSMSSGYREGLELHQGKEPGLMRAQKRASFATVVTGSDKKEVGAQVVLKRLKEVIRPEKTGIRLESVREALEGE